MNRTSVAQAARFIVVGTMNVGVDLGVYTSLLLLGSSIAFGKAAAYVAGTLFSYYMNRWWTFRVDASVGSRLPHVFLLYGATLLVNVALNSAIVAATGASREGFMIAYFFATGTSAFLNFVGLRFIFSSPKLG